MAGNRQRVLDTLNHRQPDQTPYHIGFTQPAYEAFKRYTGDPHCERLLNNCFTFTGAHLPDGWSVVRQGVVRDEYGVEWDQSIDPDIGVVCNQVVTPETLDCYVFPDPDDERRYDGIRAAVAQRDDEFIVTNIGFSLFERAWTLTGMEALLEAMVDDPPFVHALLDRIVEHNLKLIRNACRYDIDAMMFGDDWGQQHGLIMGPRFWHEFIEPRIRLMYGEAKSAGKYVIIHSCGQVDSLFPTLIDAGLDVFNPFQPEVIDVYRAKQEYGDRLCFYGGISTQRTLPYGTPEQTRDEVKRLIDEVGRDGGFFAAPAHAIPGDARPENIMAMLDVLNGQS